MQDGSGGRQARRVSSKLAAGLSAEGIDMLLEILRAIAVAGLPVGLATYALVWWSLRQGYIDPAISVTSISDSSAPLTIVSTERIRKGRLITVLWQKRHCHGQPRMISIAIRS